MLAVAPDALRNACALAALYFGTTSIYAIEVHASIAQVFALVGLWLALFAVLDMHADPCERFSA
jgi:hypothetical protein